MYFLNSQRTRHDGKIKSTQLNTKTTKLNIKLTKLNTSNQATEVIHYSDVIMSAMASQITGVTIVYSIACSGADQKTSKLRVTGLGEGNSSVTGEFSAQLASNAENVSIWWRHHYRWASEMRIMC